MFVNLLGYSAISEEGSFDEYDDDNDEKELWQSVALNRGMSDTYPDSEIDDTTSDGPVVEMTIDHKLVVSQFRMVLVQFSLV